MLIHLEKAEQFNELIAKGDVLVDFFATWCGPCKMLGAELEDLAEAHDDITIVKVNVDEFQQLSAQFNVRVVPTMVVFKNGENKKRVEGFMDQDALYEMVKNA